MFSTIVHFTCLSWPRQGVDGSPLLEFSYEASPSVVSWAPNDIPAHIEPIKNAGLGPFLPLLASFFDLACTYMLEYRECCPAFSCSFPLMLNLTSEKDLVFCLCQFLRTLQ